MVASAGETPRARRVRPGEDERLAEDEPAAARIERADLRERQTVEHRRDRDQKARPRSRGADVEERFPVGRRVHPDEGTERPDEERRSGMKYGGVASTPWMRDITKWPISWTSRMPMSVAENGRPRASNRQSASGLTPA